MTLPHVERVQGYALGIHDKEFDGLPLKGRAAELVSFSPFSLWLRFPDPAVPETSPGIDYVLRIDGPFRMVSSAAGIEVEPEAGGNAVYLGLLQRVVAEAIAAEDGSLAITFTDGDRLEIPSDVYEPWQLTGKGQTLAGAAGGGLALWNEDGGMNLPLSEYHARRQKEEGAALERGASG